MNGAFDPLSSLARAKDFRAKRISSYDVTGGNSDRWPIEPGATLTLAEMDGPGAISHIWFTVATPDKMYLRKLILRAYWDGEKEPSIEAPLGDFFGLGHGRTYSHESALFTTSCEGRGDIGGGCGMNCWAPMPFAKHARIEVVNEQTEPVWSFYSYVDYRQYTALEDDLLYFHAKWRRENPCDGWTGPGSLCWSPENMEREKSPEGKNLSDAGNYLILDAEGRGHYVGVSMSLDNLYRMWYGEGDDMFFVDGEPWPPSLHGTGTEDYFAHGWGMQKNAYLYHGQSWEEFADDFNERGKVCLYRYHVLDPVPFTKSLRVSIEHGHANMRSDDWSSCAYWYQTEPHKVFAPMPPVIGRLPNN
jgi:hypothetical protein